MTELYKLPWHWHDAFGRKDGVGEAIITDDPPVGQASRFSFAVSDDHGFVVCHCTNALVTCSTEQSEAHARLISAAPDMLLALEAICAEAESWHSNTHDPDGYSSVQCDSICALIPAMKAAINKARGRQ